MTLQIASVSRERDGNHTVAETPLTQWTHVKDPLPVLSALRLALQDESVEFGDVSAKVLSADVHTFLYSLREAPLCASLSDGDRDFHPFRLIQYPNPAYIQSAESGSFVPDDYGNGTNRLDGILGGYIQTLMLSSLTLSAEHSADVKFLDHHIHLANYGTLLLMKGKILPGEEKLRYFEAADRAFGLARLVATRTSIDVQDDTFQSDLYARIVDVSLELALLHRSDDDPFTVLSLLDRWYEFSEKHLEAHPADVYLTQLQSNINDLYNQYLPQLLLKEDAGIPNSIRLYARKAAFLRTFVDNHPDMPASFRASHLAQATRFLNVYLSFNPGDTSAVDLSLDILNARDKEERTSDQRSSQRSPVVLLHYPQERYLDLKEQILSEIRKRGGWVNTHMHLDRAGTLTAQNLHLIDAPLQEKWDLVDELKRSSSVSDIYFRMERALEALLSQGVQAVGSFLDVDAVIQEKALEAARRLREGYKDDIKLVFANQVLKGVIDQEARRWFDLAASSGVIDIIGGLPGKDAGHEEEHLDIVLGTAKQHGKRAHVHTDQFNHPEEVETELLVKKTVEYGMQGRVSAIHGISIAAHGESYRHNLYKGMRDAGVSIITCPTAWLDTKRNEVLVPAHNAVTPVDELVPAGVLVALGSDNMRDIYLPLNAADMWIEIITLAAACRFREVDQLATIATTNGLSILGLD